MLRYSSLTVSSSKIPRHPKPSTIFFSLTRLIPPILWICKRTSVALPWNGKLVAKVGLKGPQRGQYSVEPVPLRCIWDCGLVNSNDGLRLLVPRQAVTLDSRLLLNHIGPMTCGHFSMSKMPYAFISPLHVKRRAYHYFYRAQLASCYSWPKNRGFSSHLSVQFFNHSVSGKLTLQSQSRDCLVLQQALSQTHPTLAHFPY